MSKQLKFPSLRWNSSHSVVSVVIWIRPTFSQNATSDQEPAKHILLSDFGVLVLDMITRILI